MAEVSISPRHSLAAPASSHEFRPQPFTGNSGWQVSAGGVAQEVRRLATLYSVRHLMSPSARIVWVIGLLGPLAILASCTDSPTEPRTDMREKRRQPDAWLAQLLTDGSDAAAYPILVGAGDIARCYPGSDVTAMVPASETPAAATARLLDRIPGTVMAVGDNAYEFGSPFDYASCYEPTWGRHRSRTQPAAGNHEYLTPDAAGYFAYFGAAAHPETNGYYSYEIGSWHVVVLNSTPQWALCPPLPPRSSAAQGRLCAGDVAQRLWLTADLAAHPALCTVAYFHHPRYSSGTHGNQYEMQQFWDILYRAGVDIVVSGHDHDYERFAPQNADDRLDLVRGVREFVVGTGGAEPRSFGAPVPNSQVRISGRHGVLALALGSGRYGWAFVTTQGTIADLGGGMCHA